MRAEFVSEERKKCLADVRGSVLEVGFAGAPGRHWTPAQGASPHEQSKVS